MENLNDITTKYKIIETFAQWIAFSGTRSGCPLKSREDVYPLIITPNYKEILQGESPIDKIEFNDWHQKSTQDIIIKSKSSKSIIVVGWATKLINLYLKEMVYVGRYGRPNLIEYIHPPIDNGLWEGIRNNFSSRKDIIEKTHSTTRIKDIREYSDYQLIIDGMSLAANSANCMLIEVEQFWKGIEYKK